MTDSPYTTAAAVTLIEGGAGAGKTGALAARAAQLVGEGCPTDEVLVFSSTPASCREFQARLRALLGDGAALPRVTTAAAYQSELLAAAQQAGLTDRRPVVLLDFEESLLLEDLKTTQVAPKRLREMLRFFYRSWCDLEPMEGDWFYGPEEEKVYAALEEQLAWRRAYLPCELPRRSWEALAAHAAFREQQGARHVLVDDYPQLSAASQAMAGLLAQESLTVAADALQTAPALEEFPSPEGLVKLAAANPGCEHIAVAADERAPEVREALDRLVADEAFGGEASAEAEAFNAAHPLPVQLYTTAEDEFEGVADRVAALIEEGCDPAALAVAGPTRLWARNLAAALAQRSVPLAPSTQMSSGGDIRELDRCRLARLVTLLKLTADENDPVALRSWGGFGDYLANSALFNALCAAGSYLSLERAAVPGLADETPLMAQEKARVQEALAKARPLVASLRELSGPALLEAACTAVGGALELVPQPFRAALLALGDNATAADFTAAVAKAAAAPRFYGAGVRVGVLDDFAGLAVPVLFIAGLANGMLPRRSYFDPTQVERDRRPQLLAAAQHRLYEAASCARTALNLSAFTEAPLATAEKLQLKIDRIALKEGRRLCRISPSETLRTLTGVYFHD